MTPIGLQFSDLSVSLLQGSVGTAELRAAPPSARQRYQETGLYEAVYCG
jgi:hypothetical protein